MKPAPPPTPDPAQALLAHLDALYGFAQLVTPDADAAARLVRDTYARAYAADVPPDADDARAWLFRLLLDERRDTRTGLAPLPAPPERPLERPDDLDERRQLHAETLVARLLPSALLSLPTRARLLLVLCDVEGFSCAEAGEVMGLEPDVACARHAEARSALQAHLRAGAAPHEQPLLDRVLGTAAFREAVTLALQVELAPTPPTLRPQIPVPEPARTPAELTEGQEPRPWGRFAFVALLVVGAGLLGYFATRRGPAEPPALDLVELAAEDAPRAVPLLRTADAGQAERFVYDHVGWRLAAPRIEGTPLDGVGVSEVAPGVAVPVLLYGQGPGRVAVYAFTYRLLDQAPDRLRLDPDTRAQIEDDAHYDLHDLGTASALLWRDRDDLFVAVVRGSGEDLRSRIAR